MKIKQTFFIVLTALCLYCPAQQVDKEVVALQMNSCVMSITNLNESQNLSTYDRERENLLNNLSKEGMVKLPEVTSLRESILGTIYQLKITQEEREVLKRIRTMEKNGAKWQAVSNALSSAMVFIPGQGGGGQQAAFYALLTAARSAVEYGAIQNAGSIEEERALWELRKKDLQQYASLNTDAYKKINIIFKNYHLSDEYELTPNRAKEFNQIIQEANAEKRCKILLDNASSYKYFNDYYYYVGMAYLETKAYQSADKYFNQYLANEKKARLYKIDDKVGCIYLAKLQYSKKLTTAQYKEYVDLALKNLPHSGPAYIQGAIIYFTHLKSPEKAVDLLRKALYDPELTDKESVIMALTTWMPKIKKMSVYPQLYKTVCKAIDDNQSYISLNSYLAFLNSCGEADMWKELDKIILISGYKDSADIKLDRKHDVHIYKDVYFGYVTWFVIKPQRTYEVHLYKGLYVNTGYVSIFSENIKDDQLFVMEKKIDFPKGYTKKQLIKKFNLFEEYPELIIAFFDYDELAKQYYVKRSLTRNDFDQLLKTPADFDALKDVASRLDLLNDESDGREWVKKVTEFCRNHQKETPTHRILICSNDESRVKEEKENCLYLDNYFETPQLLKTINLKNLKLNPDAYARYTYSQTVKKFDGSKYRSRMYKAYNGDYIKVQMLGKNADPIYLTYHVVDGTAELVTFQVGNMIRYQVPVKTLKPITKKQAAQEKENTLVNRTVNGAKNTVEKGKSIVKSTAEITTKKVKTAAKKILTKSDSKK